MESRWLDQKLWWQDIRTRSCLLTRRNGGDSPFIRTLWDNDNFMQSFHRMAPPLPDTDQRLVEILDREYKSRIDQSRALHWIIRSPDGDACGLLSLTDLSLIHRRGEVLLGILPGSPFGIAVAAMLTLFQFYFVAIKFNKLCSLVFPDNVISLKSTLHLGFREEGQLNQHVFDKNKKQYIDVITMGLLKNEALSEKNLKLMNRLL